MLIDGQGTMFVRGILFPGGRLSPAAVAVICIWLGFLVATGWIALTLLRNGPSSRSPPPFDSSREYRSARPRHWRRWFTIFTASALALVVLFAMRLYASQRVLERDMAANQACLRRYSKAEGSLAKSQLRRGDVSAILTDAAHASKLAEASALIGVRLNAAVEERNQRRSMLTYVVIGLATVWSLAAVGRIVPLLRRRRDRRETPSTGL